MRLALGAAFAAVMIATPLAALAHPHVVSTTPATNGAVTGSPKDIRITFSEAPFPKFSGMTLTDAAGKKVAVAAPIASPSDKKQLIAAIKAPLKPGAYKVDWFAVGDDTHRVTGKFSFTVK